MSGLSDLDAVAEDEADVAVCVDRRMIQQLSPGLWIEFRHLLFLVIRYGIWYTMNIFFAIGGFSEKEWKQPSELLRRYG